MNEHEHQHQHSHEEQPQQGTDRKKLFDGIENLMGEVNKAVRITVEKATTGAEQIGDNLKETFDNVRSARDSVVMVRIDKESKERLDELVEAGVVSSRSEAAAFLITEGVKARKPMFDKIAAKIDEIRNAKDGLRRLLQDEDGLNQEPRQPSE
ncbi:MAG: ribbon-helix-helix protein, CopG family [Ardenticatenaceae bacterium]